MSTRILVSRNKREGGYCGWRFSRKPRHVRVGSNDQQWPWPRKTLRELSRL